jgi:hypothetical protein
MSRWFGAHPPSCQWVPRFFSRSTAAGACNLFSLVSRWKKEDYNSASPTTIKGVVPVQSRE